MTEAHAHSILFPDSIVLQDTMEVGNLISWMERDIEDVRSSDLDPEAKTREERAIRRQIDRAEWILAELRELIRWREGWKKMFTNKNQ
jgi:hypothetical protein